MQPASRVIGWEATTSLAILDTWGGGGLGGGGWVGGEGYRGYIGTT